MKSVNVMRLSALAVAVLLAAPAQARHFVVSSAGDSGPGTLRQAVLDANATPGPHTIGFSLPPGSTIALTSGQIAFTGPEVTIRGGHLGVIISGHHHSRIFDVEAGRLSLVDLTLRDGLAQGDATNFYDEVGGAIRVGALPTPASAARVAALLSATRAQVPRGTAAGGSRETRRAMRVQTLQLMQSLTPASNASAPLALTLDHVALLHNRAEAPDLAFGGAVAVVGGANLVVRNSLFKDNSTPFAGGAIFAMGAPDFTGGSVAAGNFDIRDSAFIANHIDQNGTEAGQGAAFMSYGPGGTIRRSVFRRNFINDAPPDQGLSEGLGGGLALLLNVLPIRIEDSEISDNSIVLRPGVFSEGAGLYCDGLDDNGEATPLTIVNSTISNNQAVYGAAIEAGCNLQLFNSTVAGNISQGDGVPNSGGGGDAVELIFDQGKFNATSSLIFNPAAHVDLFLFRGATNLGTVSKSLIFAPDPSTPPLPPATLIGLDPRIAPLADNGGPTRTHALRAGSPAINAGSNPLGLGSDQRGPGFARVVGRYADIGAVECTHADRWRHDCGCQP